MVHIFAIETFYLNWHGLILSGRSMAYVLWMRMAARKCLCRYFINDVRMIIPKQEKLYVAPFTNRATSTFSLSLALSFRLI